MISGRMSPPRAQARLMDRFNIARAHPCSLFNIRNDAIHSFDELQTIDNP